MAESAAPDLALSGERLTALLRAGLLTAVVDGLFSSALSVFAYGSTVSRLFQGVASTVLGSAAFDGGAATALLGVGMHFAVAFTWSAIFVFVVLRSRRIRDLLASPFGPAKVGALYGPLIWMAMSLVVIPVLTRRPPSFGVRWWVQLIGHFPFVGIPIAAASRGMRA